MGLDVSHDAWSGGYGSFHAWRKCVAAAYGIPLELMEGYWYKTSREEQDTAFYKYVEALPISWDVIKVPLAIKMLLYHSDCEGHIGYKTCGRLAKELYKILPDMKSPFPRWSDEEIRETTKQFADGCLDAFKRKEKLIFS